MIEKMKLTDICWKLDGLADSSVTEATARTAARESAYALREISNLFGVDPAGSVADALATIRAKLNTLNEQRAEASPDEVNKKTLHWKNLQ